MTVRVHFMALPEGLMSATMRRGQVYAVLVDDRQGPQEREETIRHELGHILCEVRRICVNANPFYRMNDTLIAVPLRPEQGRFLMPISGPYTRFLRLPYEYITNAVEALRTRLKW